jgi:exopolysaccharide biosynthesis polyprenyl glycosylphosphotransferase
MLKLRFGGEAALMWQKHLNAFVFIYPLWFISFYIFGLYDLKLAKNTSEFYLSVLKATVLNGFISTTLLYLFPSFFGLTPRTNLFLNLLFFGILVFLWHQVYNLIIKSPNLTRQVIIIGKNPKSLEIKERIDQNPQLGYKVISIIDPEKEILNLKKENNYTIVTSINLNHYPELAKKLYQYLPYFNFEKFSDFYERITSKVPLSQIDEVWFLDNLKEREMIVYEKVKRLIDIVFGLVLGIITIIIFPIIALLIKIDSPGPVFYTQHRIGKDEKEFKLVKFRSMINDAEKNGAVWAQKNDTRITRVGKIIRKTLIDELPQFINIIKGEISLIGARPERLEFVKKLEKEIPFYNIRHLAKPGLTGWAQINFKYGNTISDALEKLQYELYYIKNRSLLLDLRIILKTINIILKGGTL